jgi:hypothetical protein
VGPGARPPAVGRLVTPMWVLWLWLGVSLVGLVWSLRLSREAWHDVAAARRAVAEGLHPERIVPLGEAYLAVKALFALGFAANVAAGIAALLRAAFADVPLLVVPALIAGNVLFAAAMVRTAHMRRAGLAAIAADLADARQLDHIHDVVEDNNAVLHRLEDAERGPG